MEDDFGSVKCPECGEVSDGFTTFVEHHGECPYCGARPDDDEWIEVDD